MYGLAVNELHALENRITASEIVAEIRRKNYQNVILLRQRTAFAGYLESK